MPIGTAKTSKRGGLVAKSCPTLVTLRTIACQNPLSVEFSRHEYWSGLPFPSPGDLANPGMEPGSPALWVDSLSTKLCSIYLISFKIKSALVRLILGAFLQLKML